MAIDWKINITWVIDKLLNLLWVIGGVVAVTPAFEFYKLSIIYKNKGFYEGNEEFVLIPMLVLILSIILCMRSWAYVKVFIVLAVLTLGGFLAIANSFPANSQWHIAGWVLNFCLYSEVIGIVSGGIRAYRASRDSGGQQPPS